MGNCENSDVPADEQTLDIYYFLIQKLEIQDGVVTGMHGTSAAIARQIESEGLHNNKCIEGNFGVWFVDDSVSNQAAIHGVRKARDLGDNGYAVITARLKSPQPDIRGRKQWLANASGTEVIDIRYYKIDE